MKRSVFSFLTALAVLVTVFSFTATASASSLSDSWDFGDISGSYWTSSDAITNSTGSFTWTQLGSNIDCQHQIDSVQASFSPLYTYLYDSQGNYIGKTKNGYQVSESISGRISTSTTTADLKLSQYQQNQINARGLVLSEWTGLFGYNSSGDPSALDIEEQGGANVALQNFVVSYAYASYDEWTSIDGGGEGKGAVPADSGSSVDTTYFDYSVTWNGDFLSGTLSTNFVAPSSATEIFSPASVPEPASLSLLAFGVLGCIRRRSR